MMLRAGTPPERPLLVFDGECGFCTRWIARWKRVTGERIDYRPYQEVAQAYPEIPVEEFQRSIRLIEPDGRVTEGAEALLLALSSVKGWPLWVYRHAPGARSIAEAVYRFIAAHRPFFSRLTR